MSEIQRKPIRFARCNPSIPANISWEAWIDGEEERYGTAYGASKLEALNNMRDAIEVVDGVETVFDEVRDVAR